MQYIAKMRVYDYASVEECYEKTRRAPISVRWVDTNKTADEQNPNVRSRLVAQEFKNGGDAPELFSPTPPLELFKCLLALTAIGHRDPASWQT